MSKTEFRALVAANVLAENRLFLDIEYVLDRWHEIDKNLQSLVQQAFITHSEIHAKLGSHLDRWKGGPQAPEQHLKLMRQLAETQKLILAIEKLIGEHSLPLPPTPDET